MFKYKFTLLCVVLRKRKTIFENYPVGMKMGIIFKPCLLLGKDNVFLAVFLYFAKKDNFLL